MKVISVSGHCKPLLKKTCAAIGIFDGVHRGHQYLIREMVLTARRLKLTPIVITFFPHPVHVIRPDIKLDYLTSLIERYRLLAELGVKVCVVVNFDKSFAKIEPQKFIEDILVKNLGVKAIFVGNYFRFGKDRAGDIALFQQLSSVYHYEVHPVAALKQGKEVISSTRIRKVLIDGKLNEAAKLLGRPVSTSGKVVKGSERGKSLGYPTANIAYESDALPSQGVYAVNILLGRKLYPAIANLGTRPSFDKQISKLHLEVHILDFEKDIYGKEAQVQFLKKIRNDMKFKTPQTLIRQIQKDESFARRYFLHNPQ